MSNKTECEIFRQRDRYPKKWTFKPTRLRLPKFAVAPIMRRLGELVNPHVDTSDDIEDPRDWEQKGSCWVRKNEGENPHCWTSSRVGKTVQWRDSVDSYCCAGFPYFTIKQLEGMLRTMETFKPLLRVESPGTVIELAMARSIANPHGVCWGLSTLDTWYELTIDGKRVGGELSLNGVRKFLPRTQPKKTTNE